VVLGCCLINRRLIALCEEAAVKLNCTFDVLRRRPVAAGKLNCTFAVLRQAGGGGATGSTEDTEAH
jgi:hypothetical protein